MAGPIHEKSWIPFAFALTRVISTAPVKQAYDSGDPSGLLRGEALSGPFLDLGMCPVVRQS